MCLCRKYAVIDEIYENKIGVDFFQNISRNILADIQTAVLAIDIQGFINCRSILIIDLCRFCD